MTRGPPAAPDVVAPVTGRIASEPAKPDASDRVASTPNAARRRTVISSGIAIAPPVGAVWACEPESSDATGRGGCPACWVATRRTGVGADGVVAEAAGAACGACAPGADPVVIDSADDDEDEDEEADAAEEAAAGVETVGAEGGAAGAADDEEADPAGAEEAEVAGVRRTSVGAVPVGALAGALGVLAGDPGRAVLVLDAVDADGAW
ncbi:hypothetical protein [Nocardioides sp. W7]|uniref:hypothetical protein n=1 Tax=Nocardioides sp. W7 TaxID=2931390 RepID=UPI001FD2C303|nr:hypothetical protein [Nocardioides sp. W7]